MSDWWAKKLGAPQQQYPRGIVLPPTQPQPLTQQPQMPQHPVQAPQHPTLYPDGTGPDGKQHVLDPNLPADAEVTMGRAMRLWKGGQAQRMEGNMACPSCGSATGYTAYSSVSGQRPRPHCFECGYNGHFTQGLESSWA